VTLKIDRYYKMFTDNTRLGVFLMVLGLATAVSSDPEKSDSALVNEEKLSLPCLTIEAVGGMANAPHVELVLDSHGRMVGHDRAPGPLRHRRSGKPSTLGHLRALAGYARDGAAIRAKRRGGDGDFFLELKIDAEARGRHALWLLIVALDTNIEKVWLSCRSSDSSEDTGQAMEDAGRGLRFSLAQRRDAGHWPRSDERLQLRLGPAGEHATVVLRDRRSKTRGVRLAAKVPAIKRELAKLREAAEAADGESRHKRGEKEDELRASLIVDPGVRWGDIVQVFGGLVGARIRHVSLVFTQSDYEEFSAAEWKKQLPEPKAGKELGGRSPRICVTFDVRPERTGK